MFPFTCLFPLVVWIAYIDLKTLRIPNILIGVAILIFIATVPAIGMDVAGPRFLNGIIAFFICFAGFYFGLMGGGDAKFIPVIFLFVPAEEIAVFLYCLAGGMAAGMLGLRAIRKSGRLTAATLAAIDDQRVFPIGVALALASGMFLTLQLSVF
jgi:prepilin peptidase CpaA